MFDFERNLTPQFFVRCAPNGTDFVLPVRNKIICPPRSHNIRTGRRNPTPHHPHTRKQKDQRNRTKNRTRNCLKSTAVQNSRGKCLLVRGVYSSRIVVVGVTLQNVQMSFPIVQIVHWKQIRSQEKEKEKERNVPTIPYLTPTKRISP